MTTVPQQEDLIEHIHSLRDRLQDVGEGFSIFYELKKDDFKIRESDEHGITHVDYSPKRTVVSVTFALRASASGLRMTVEGQGATVLSACEDAERIARLGVDHYQNRQR